VLNNVHQEKLFKEIIKNEEKTLKNSFPEAQKLFSSMYGASFSFVSSNANKLVKSKTF
jgi:hypothetical protein